MNYQITITRIETNPEYEKEIKEIDVRSNYTRGYETRFEPQREVIKNVLLVELTEDQFKKVKLEVLKAFE